jgi:signal peptidase I
MNRIIISWLKEWIPILGGALIISLLLNHYVVQAVNVPTGSMIPTVMENDRFFIEKISSSDHYSFGDIIVFDHIAKDTGSVRYLKRLIGLPGDTIEVRNGKLIRNGVSIEEPYLNGEVTYSFEPITVPKDHFFVLGDNRNVSYDSHLWPHPFVPMDQVQGKVILQYYPDIKVFHK